MKVKFNLTRYHTSFKMMYKMKGIGSFSTETVNNVKSIL